MITTSNFAKSGKHADAVAISQGVPRFYRGKRYMLLAPPRWLLKAEDPELFDREYRKQLESLDAKQVAEDLGANAILLCWESFNVRCHRRLVAEWLEARLGIVVPELGHARTESLPFSEQPSKWDGKPTTAQLPMTF
jgi:Protein of unknown function, DUF488